MKYIHHLPTVGCTVALGFFVVAAGRYPGGTTHSSDTVGYHWTQNFISSLFAPQALNGEDDAARPIAAAAMLLLCASLGAMFYSISTADPLRLRRKMIEIGGIGSMVYGALVVTPMHDLMVTIGLLFYLAALAAILHLLFCSGRRLLVTWGVSCLALSLSSAVMYYGALFYDLLPVIQKLHWSATIGWLVAVYYAMRSVEGEPEEVGRPLDVTRDRIR